MNAIVAVDEKWSIGRDGELLVRIPADQKYFRRMTEGCVVIMGRKTLESFPGGRPLKNRVNIVVTRDPAYQAEGAVTAHSVPEAVRAAESYGDRPVFVIGGGEIYREMLPLCDTVYVTKIEYTYDADTRFPDLDADPAWEITEESEEQTYFDLVFRFLTYTRR